MKQIRIGLLGLGQVGTGIYKILTKKQSFLKKKTGCTFKLAKIAVKNPSKKRSVSIPKGLLTAKAQDILSDPTIDLVVELIGGTTVAKQYVLTALRNGKDVVTANKALLAEHGQEIFQAAAKAGRSVYFEASVAGGIPIIKSLREGLISNRISSIFGILNGTCNYILSRMTREELDFKDVLKQAQAKGYAEANPELDINGGDTAHKIAILAALAFGERVRFEDVACEGIKTIDKHDIAFAAEFGYVIKLLAIAKRTASGIECRVQPTLVAEDHILAKVDGANNAVLIRGDEVGEVLLYGPGAGPQPTASAVVSDIVDFSVGRYWGEQNPWLNKQRVKLKPLSLIKSRYYLRFSVIDRPGVLARIAGILGKHNVSVSDVIQSESKTGNVVPLIMITHDADEKSIQTAIKAIRTLKAVHSRPHVFRIEG